jgi:pimeloyl-ACP methyl ester carboxylesterase
MLSVPMDYADPNGRKINVAVSRHKATDPAKRRGVLVISSGGPGLKNITDSVDSADPAVRPMLAPLATEYDLIGLDLRGIGYSDNIDCHDTGGGEPLPPNASDKDMAQNYWQREKGFNQLCTAADPAFVRQLTTTNNARDIDALRAALGESKISFYGASYGTAIGLNYRSLFDSHVDKMWLDSPLPPVLDMAAMDADLDAAGQQNFDRFLPWLAGHDAEYHFGGTVDGVRTALFALRDRMDRSPRPVDDHTVINGRWVRQQFGGEPGSWMAQARDLATVRDGGIPQSARSAPGVPRTAFGFGDKPFSNSLEYNAIFCNEGAGGRDIDQIWAAMDAAARKYPATGGGFGTQIFCGGWPWPAQPWHIVKGHSTFQLSGHLYEGTTPYAWAVAAHEAAGGGFLTVQDASHGSITRIPCGSKLTEFFRTGRTVNGSCPGQS